MADDKPKNADFIGRVVKDAKNPVETRMLVGWFGDSGEKGTRRLYTDPELTSYVDIPDEAILYTEAVKDSQPAGGVVVWIKRDASVQSGGSAASRAGRFLQGQVAADFGAPGSLEKAGLRCVTEVPCGEPTGFTGQCTKQPNVGGAWPCVTEVPHCVEVTGFTGQCTNAPWPHPTRYVGCTYLHCPTYDLTHIPHICNIVASGQPGCVVVNPPQGGEAEKKAGAAENEKLPETAIPGCGYTKTWGLCETHLLGCGYTKNWGDCPTNPILCDPAGPQQANAAFAAAAPAAANIAITGARCPSPVPCSDFVACTQVCGNQTKAPTALCTPAPKVCETFCGPACQTKQVQPVCTSINCVTPATPPCPQTQPPQCPLTVTGPVACCIAQQGAGLNEVGAQALQAQQACAAGTIHPTIWTQIGPACPTNFPGCGYTHRIPCVSPGIDCTAIICTRIGPNCHTHQFPQCPTRFECTIVCTQGAPECTGIQCFPPLTAPPQCPPISGFNCPSAICPQSIACQSQACQPQGGGLQQQAQFVGGPQPTFATVCTQFGCQTHQLPCPTGGIDCTVICPTRHVTICPTHQHPCPTGGIDCTVICPTHHVTQCPTAPATICPTHLPAACPPLTHPPQCPIASGFNCPSAICPQSIACQSQACQPGGGGIEQQQAARVGMPGTLAATVCTQFAPCHTHPPGDCTFFNCTHLGPQCPTAPATICRTHQHPCISPGIDCTAIVCTRFGPGCPPTPATVCTQPVQQCNPSAIDACPTRVCTQLIECNPSAIDACPTRIGCPTQNPQQCTIASGFNCPSAICPQSIACQSQACQPQGGGLQQQAQFVGGPQPTLATVCTQLGCPTHAPMLCMSHPVPCPTGGIDCTVICPTRHVTICPTHQHPCPTGGIDCTVICPTHHVTQCPTAPATICPTHLPAACPPLTHPPQCPIASGFNCPSAICPQSIACQSQACQPGGGGQQQQAQFVGAAANTQLPHCQLPTPFCFPTPICTPLICPQPHPGQQAQARQGIGHSFVPHQCYTFFNPCNTMNIDCWFANFWAFA